MKTYWTILLSIIILLSGCINKKEASIHIQFNSEIPDRFGLTIEPSHNLNYRSRDLLIDSTGQLEFEIGINASSIMMMGGNSYLCFLLVQPGDELNITFNGPFYQLPFDNNDSSSSIIDGSNFMGQVALNKSIKNKFAYLKSYYEEWDITQPNNLIANLKDTISNDIAVFQALHEEGKINKTFLQIVSKFIGYQNAYRLGQTIIYNIREENIDSTKIEEELMVVEEILDMYPINTEDVLFNFNNLRSYIGLFLGYQKLKNEDEFKRYSDSGLSKTYRLSVVKQNTPITVYEKYAVDYLWGSTFRGGGQEDIELYDAFIEEFPECKYQRLLTRLTENIENIKRINSQASKQYPEGTYIIENYKNLNSFEELIARFNGKNLYIDIWATWCGPCLYDLGQSDQLKEFAETNKIDIIYISVDEEGYRDKWENYIKHYNIKGYHILANELLNQNLDSVIPEFRSIPRYLIVNANGEIVESDANRPSDGDELLAQLASKLNL